METKSKMNQTKNNLQRELKEGMSQIVGNPTLSCEQAFKGMILNLLKILTVAAIEMRDDNFRGLILDQLYETLQEKMTKSTEEKYFKLARERNKQLLLHNQGLNCHTKEGKEAKGKAEKCLLDLSLMIRKEARRQINESEVDKNE